MLIVGCVVAFILLIILISIVSAYHAERDRVYAASEKYRECLNVQDAQVREYNDTVDGAVQILKSESNVVHRIPEELTKTVYEIKERLLGKELNAIDRDSLNQELLKLEFFMKTSYQATGLLTSHALKAFDVITQARKDVTASERLIQSAITNLANAIQQCRYFSASRYYSVPTRIVSPSDIAKLERPDFASALR